MTNEDDGGIWALTGYLYQIVGMLGITARISTLTPRATALDDVLAGLQNVGDLLTQVQHEAGGEDALLQFRRLGLDQEDDYVLLQFKCSATGDPIGGDDVKEIVKKLDKHAVKLLEAGRNVTACVLVTNRRFTSGRGDRAEERWEAEKATPRPYDLRRIPDYSIEQSISALEGFAEQYGVLEEEMKQGIKWLIGEVFYDILEPVRDRSVRKDDLVRAFTGSSDAKPLTTDTVNEETRQELVRFGDDRIDADRWDGNFVEREVFQDVLEAVNEERALVGICGPGGCGKSVLVWQLLSGLSDKRCCAIVPSEQLSGTWIENKVREWGGSRRCADTREQAIKRLLIANRDSPQPILLLGLDGMDEGYLSRDREDETRQLLLWFWQKDRGCAEDIPKATLIVSLREEKDLRRWLRIRPGHLHSGPLPLCFTVKSFSEQETKEAARRRAPELYQRIREHQGSHRVQGQESGQITGSIDTSVFGAQSSSDVLASVNDAVWSSLKHPAMWQALLSLDRDTRLRAFEGEQDATNELAHRFLLWFGWKLDMREQKFQNLVDNDCAALLEILAEVAKHSSRTGKNSRDIHWVEPARSTMLGISRLEAVDLYRQALSSGLLDKDSLEEDLERVSVDATWRWRHTIVYDYLRNNTQGGATL